MDERWFTVQMYKVADSEKLLSLVPSTASMTPACTRNTACLHIAPRFEQCRSDRGMSSDFYDIYKCPSCSTFILIRLQMTATGRKQLINTSRIAPGDQKTLQLFLSRTEEVEIR